MQKQQLKSARCSIEPKQPQEQRFYRTEPN